MKCPFCSSGTKVIDSRPSSNTKNVRRRRECPLCLTRFNTNESIILNSMEKHLQEKLLRK